MRKMSWIVIGLAAFALAVGCTSTDDDVNTGPANGGSSGGGHSPTPNGVGVREQEACETLLAAFGTHASRLGCNYTLPECPGYIRQSGAPACSLYDDGTVQGCADFYGTFMACGEFQNRPCHINNIENSAPNGCNEIPDASADAEADAEADAGADAKTDVNDQDAAGDAADSAVDDVATD